MWTTPPPDDCPGINCTQRKVTAEARVAGKGPAECVCRALGKVRSPLLSGGGLGKEAEAQLLLTEAKSGVNQRPFTLLPIIFWEDDISGITKNHQKQLAQLAQKLALCRLEVVAIHPHGSDP